MFSLSSSVIGEVLPTRSVRHVANSLSSMLILPILIPSDLLPLRADKEVYTLGQVHPVAPLIDSPSNPELEDDHSPPLGPSFFVPLLLG